MEVDKVVIAELIAFKLLLIDLCLDSLELLHLFFVSFLDLLSIFRVESAIFMDSDCSFEVRTSQCLNIWSFTSLFKIFFSWTYFQLFSGVLDLNVQIFAEFIILYHTL